MSGPHLNAEYLELAKERLDNYKAEARSVLKGEDIARIGPRGNGSEEGMCEPAYPLFSWQVDDGAP